MQYIKYIRFFAFFGEGDRALSLLGGKSMGEVWEKEGGDLVEVSDIAVLFSVSHMGIFRCPPTASNLRSWQCLGATRVHGLTGSVSPRVSPPTCALPGPSTVQLGRVLYIMLVRSPVLGTLEHSNHGLNIHWGVCSLCTYAHCYSCEWGAKHMFRKHMFLVASFTPSHWLHKAPLWMSHEFRGSHDALGCVRRRSGSVWVEESSKKLLGWRPSLVRWRPLLLGRRPSHHKYHSGNIPGGLAHHESGLAVGLVDARF